MANVDAAYNQSTDFTEGFIALVVIRLTTPSTLLWPKQVQQEMGRRWGTIKSYFNLIVLKLLKLYIFFLFEKEDDPPASSSGRCMRPFLLIIHKDLTKAIHD